ncbi:hypothetical protein COMA1_10652 [Candidatus Nitrospira nitrosa]|uniref:Uncharacterized protein n=1 Tax=Candidatus Nitrospira nitrosa TaxID=1742972 RepID=A0A0S4L9D1_9BACT|nr:hypothetical protein [Candidatus Nitrospira nitrosa]CUS32491.1 hypothetical protein COMA1_10652 [Candidatus Nitrospira nitrosa]
MGHYEYSPSEIMESVTDTIAHLTTVIGCQQDSASPIEHAISEQGIAGER